MSFLSAPQLCDAAQRCQSHTARLNVDNLLLLHHFLSAPGMFDAAQRYQSHEVSVSVDNLLLLSFVKAPPGGSLLQYAQVMSKKCTATYANAFQGLHRSCHLCHDKPCQGPCTQQFRPAAIGFCHFTPCQQNSDTSDCLSSFLLCYIVIGVIVTIVITAVSCCCCCCCCC